MVPSNSVEKKCFSESGRSQCRKQDITLKQKFIIPDA